MFQHTAARRRLGLDDRPHDCRDIRFNTQPPEGGWTSAEMYRQSASRFNTQPPEGGWRDVVVSDADPFSVSTHSRPKAAGRGGKPPCAPAPCFNTQPPEGGWAYIGDDGEITIKFQHTAARRRLEMSRISKW